MHFMYKFEANRYGFHDAMAENRPFGTLTFWQSSLSFFKLNTDFFQEIVYWNSPKDNSTQLMCKLEANRCGFREAMAKNRPFKTLTFMTVITFILQTQHRFSPQNLILDFSKRYYVQLMCKFEANRCGFHGAMAEN